MIRNDVGWTLAVLIACAICSCGRASVNPAANSVQNSPREKSETVCRAHGRDSSGSPISETSFLTEECVDLLRSNMPWLRSDFETAAAAAPEQPWATLAFYQAGLARDETGEFSACAENFRKAVHGSTSLPQQHDARVRLVRVLVFLERWDEAGQEADAMLELEKGLRPIEVVVARGARAMAALDKGELEPAERDIEVARSLVEDHQLQLPVKIHRDVAVIYFALGELRRRRAESIRFVPPYARLFAEVGATLPAFARRAVRILRIDARL